MTFKDYNFEFAQIFNGAMDFGMEGGIPYIKLTSADGTVYYLFADNSGTLRMHTAIPEADSDGTELGTQGAQGAQGAQGPQGPQGA